jgi:SAM-dependent methyltransferase
MQNDEWAQWREQVDLDDYDTRWARMAAEGANPHGEADFVMGFRPSRVLDAGCGTGRVALELSARGVDVVGVDLDVDLLDRARAKGPTLTWVTADLAEIGDLDLGPPFDLIVAAGNVIGFVAPDRREAAVHAVARHLAPGGHLVSGAQLRPGWPTVGEYDGWCRAVGLELEGRFATWEGDPLEPEPDYAVAVHRRPA